MGKMTIDLATQEVTKWLDFKNVPDRKREANADHIEALAEAIANGKLILQEDKVFTLKLSFPTGEDGKGISELNFKPRVKVSTLSAQLQGMKPGDGVGIMVGYISALTGEVKGVIKDLDLSDYEIAQSIAIFFI